MHSERQIARSVGFFEFVFERELGDEGWEDIELLRLIIRKDLLSQAD
jgi:hypothetical protein